jgi:hypothetical protein
MKVLTLLRYVLLWEVMYEGISIITLFLLWEVMYEGIDIITLCFIVGGHV